MNLKNNIIFLLPQRFFLDQKTIFKIKKKYSLGALDNSVSPLAEVAKGEPTFGNFCRRWAAIFIICSVTKDLNNCQGLTNKRRKMFLIPHDAAEVSSSCSLLSSNPCSFVLLRLPWWRRDILQILLRGCVQERQYRKIGNSKNRNFFFHQRHALWMSFNIFVVTYRVTNFLPKLVNMLLFSVKKTEFPFLVSPYFRLLPTCTHSLTCFHRLNCGSAGKRDVDAEAEAEGDPLFKCDVFFPGKGDTCESYFGECCEVCFFNDDR